MDSWLAIILSGMFVYWLLARDPRRSSRTSTWILMLVLMIPPLFTVGFLQVYKKLPSPYWVVPIWLGSAGVYWWLNRPLLNGKPSQATESENPDRSEESPASKDLVQPQQVASLQQMSNEEEIQLRECFPWAVYFLDSIEYRAQGIVCRGKLRANAEEAYQTVTQNIQTNFENRFFVLFQSGFSDRPFFVLVPNVGQGSNVKKNRPFHYMLMVSSGVLAWACACQMGAYLMEPKFTGSAATIPAATQGWPYALTLLGTLGARDVGRWLAARYHQLQTGLLYFLPLPFFPGSCGTLMQLREPLPHRRVLFDLGLCGGVVSLIASLAGLWWGLHLSPVVALSKTSGILNFQSCDPRFSLLLTIVSKLALGKNLGPDVAISLHPVAVAAYLGFLLTAINLLPFKRFDGGNIVHAMYGVRGSVIIGQVTKTLLLILGFVQYRFSGQNGSLIFAILLTFFPTVSDPTLNDVAEIDGRRDLLGFLLLAIAVLIFMPVGGQMASWLGV
jgi:hypothetical protein